MTILIIGASGFIGIDLANYLADSGNEVTCMDVAPNELLKHPSIELVQGDVTDYEYLSDGMVFYLYRIRFHRSETAF